MCLVQVLMIEISILSAIIFTLFLLVTMNMRLFFSIMKYRGISKCFVSRKWEVRNKLGGDDNAYRVMVSDKRHLGENSF